MTRGFTLLELVVGASIGLAIVALATGLTVGALAHVRHSRALAQLHRDGSFVAQLLDDDLRHAGLGVPPGPHIVTGERLIPMLVAAPDAVGFLGDVARPDAQYNTFGPLESRPTRSRDVARGAGATFGVAWHTENNGPCMPGAPGDPCRAYETSLFFPTRDPRASCTVDAADRTCPWGVRRVRPGEDLQIVAADKTWATSRAAGTVALLLVPGLAADRSKGLLAAPVSLRLADPLEPGRVFRQVFKAADPDPVLWRDQEPGTLPGGSVGQGFVTTLDRVFYFVSGAALVRVQCWGKPAPSDAQWPRLAGPNAVPSSIRTGAPPPPNCTPREVVARDVEGAHFRYFDAADREIAGDARASANRIEFEIDFRRTPAVGAPARYAATGSVTLQNS